MASTPPPGTTDHNELAAQNESLYTSLQLPTPTSIRLITLFMDPDDDVGSTMKVYELESAPPFAALSYTWGKEKPNFFISCNGFDRIRVTENLNKALTRLMSPSRYLLKASHSTIPDAKPDVWGPEVQHYQSGGKVRMLWIDALCINQADNEEKAKQVRIMDRIYSKATRVITWLDTPFIDFPTMELLAWAAMQYLGMQKSPTMDFDESRLPEPGTASWDQCISLFQNQYFHRVWIIQEIALAKSAVLFFDKYEMEWLLFGSAACLLKSRKWYWQQSKPMLPFDPERNPFEQAVSILELHESQKKQWPLLPTLQRFHRSNSTAAVDKVFAFVGMTPGPDVQVDYKKPKGDVFRQVARAIIAHDNNIDVLSCVPWTQFHYGPVEPRTQGINDVYLSSDPSQGLFFMRILSGSDGLESFQPYAEIESKDETPSSWAPYWDITDFGPEVQPIITKRTPYNAAGDVTLAIVPNNQDKLLTLKGVSIDTIESCADVTGDDGSFYIAPNTEDFPAQIKNHFEDVFADPSSPNPLNKDLKWAFAMALVAGLNSSLEWAEDDPAFQAEACRYWESILGEPFLSLPQDINTVPVTFSVEREHPTGGVQEQSTLRNPGASSLASNPTQYLATHLGSNTYYTPISSDEHIESCEQCLVARNYCSRVMTMNYRRRVFRTKRGYFGLGNSNLKTGDQVVCLFSGKAPFVLRKKGEVWRCVGDCFVEGCMRGEFVESWKKGELKEQIFAIS